MHRLILSIPYFILNNSKESTCWLLNTFFIIEIIHAYINIKLFNLNLRGTFKGIFY